MTFGALVSEATLPRPNDDIFPSHLRKRRQTKSENGSCGCGTVGRMVTFSTREPRFESSHRQILHTIKYIGTKLKSTKEAKKRPGMGELKK